MKGVIGGQLKWMNGTFYILKYLEYFFVFFIALAHIKTIKQIKFYIFAILLTFFIVNICAAVQIGHGIRVSAPFEGLRGEPNTLGGYQVLIIALTIGLIIYKNFLNYKYILLGLTIFSLIPFTYTLSRASYSAIIPMYLSFIWLIKSKARNFLLGILILLIIVSMFFFPQNIKSRITDAFTPDRWTQAETIGDIKLGGSASERIRSWKIVIEKWKEKPFWGHGVTSIGFLDGQYFRILGELGLLGLTAFLLLIYHIIRLSFKYYRMTKNNLLKGIALGFIAGNIGLLVHAITANTFIIIRIMEPYWLLAAIVMSIPYVDPDLQPIQNTNESNTPARPHPPNPLKLKIKNPHLAILLKGRTH
ncbi:MAG: O-antigen ligase family protein [Candidatus Omnitrophica bacterium]|nr:O-antigen ligase family protein [Candidatus Omnitrophota bacterium]